MGVFSGLGLKDWVLGEAETPPVRSQTDHVITGEAAHRTRLKLAKCVKQPTAQMNLIDCEEFKSSQHHCILEEFSGLCTWGGVCVWGGGGGRDTFQCRVNGDVPPNKVWYSSLNSKTGCLSGLGLKDWVLGKAEATPVRSQTDHVITGEVAHRKRLKLVKCENKTAKQHKRI